MGKFFWKIDSINYFLSFGIRLACCSNIFFRELFKRPLILELIEHLVENLYWYFSVGFTLLDLTKAFDTVDDKILSEKC